MKAIAELNRIRLDRNLPFQALADEVGIPMRSLHRILTTPRAKVHDRTLHKIRRYLEAQREAARA